MGSDYVGGAGLATEGLAACTRAALNGLRMPMSMAAAHNPGRLQIGAACRRP